MGTEENSGGTQQKPLALGEISVLPGQDRMTTWVEFN